MLIYAMNPLILCAPDLMYDKRGNHTKIAVDRCAELSGQHFKDVRSIFLEGFRAKDHFSAGHTQKAAKRLKCARKFFKDFHKEGLFSNKLGQPKEHPSFPEFRNSFLLRDPSGLGKKLAKLTASMDQLSTMFVN
jgi:hypothetical protein